MRVLKFAGAAGLLLATAAMAPPAAAQEPGEPLGFVEAIQQALSANQGLAAQRAGVAATSENIALARSEFLPQVALGGGGFFKDISSSVDTSLVGADFDQTGPFWKGELSQVIYDHSKFQGVKIQQSLLRGAEESFRGASNQLVLQAGLAYMEVLLARDLVDVQAENLSLTRTNLELTRELESRGVASRQEVLRWQTQEYSDEQTVVSAESSLLQSRVSFNQLRNRSAEEGFELRDLTLETSGFFLTDSAIAAVVGTEDADRVMRDFMVDVGLERSPKLAALGAQIAAQQREVGVAKLKWLPSAALFGGRDQVQIASSGVRTDTGIWFVGVVVEWPIFQGGSVRAGRRQAEAQLQQLQRQSDESSSSLESQIRAATSEALASYRTWELTGRQAEAAAENYRLVSDAYGEGESSLLDLLDAQSTKIEAELARTSAYYQLLADLLGLETTVSYFHFLEPPDDVDQRVRALRRRIEGGS